LVDYLEPGTVLVLNKTKVIPARLHVTNQEGKIMELFILEKHGKQDHLAIYRGKLTVGEKLFLGKNILEVTEVASEGIVKIKTTVDLYALVKKFGETPIPPYLKRKATALDKTRYQTIFAKEEGSVAAPTASLNFTKKLAQKLRAKKIIIKYLTLHVGLGTFMPIRDDDLTKHHMHSEFYTISKSTVSAILKAKQEGRAVCALGTTVVRALEDASTQILQQKPCCISKESNIFIYPPYTFQIVDKLLTNFHAPRSTVLMLAAAFAGKDFLQKAYKEAITKQYHFLSYGDSMLIL
jgi:S-adenosylmethionine:tRNA ribosyltransferase-isomerase